MPPSRTRLQDYDATLSLKVKDADALSNATKRALAVARSLGGYASAVSVDVQKGEGDATIRLRVPVGNVQRAVERLSALGTITGESVAIRDLQAGVDALDKRITRLQKRLAVLRAQEQTAAVKRQIASLTAQVERLQRGRAGTVREARLATVDLSMTTREAPKPPKKHESRPARRCLDGARLDGDRRPLRADRRRPRARARPCSPGSSGGSSAAAATSSCSASRAEDRRAAFSESG